MQEPVEISATGTVHEIRDPEGASYRFVSNDDSKLTSIVIFQEGLSADNEITKHKDVKISVTIGTNKV